MAKKLFFFAMTLFISAQLPAQDADTGLENQFRLDLTPIGLGVSYELPLSPQHLLEGEAGLAEQYQVYSNGWYSQTVVTPCFYLDLHGKYYYNRADRLERGKTLDFNSGTFIGLHTQYVTPSLLGRHSWHVFAVGIHWGFQYKIGNRWSYAFYVGPGITSNLSEGRSASFIDANIKFSYVLPL